MHTAFSAPRIPRRPAAANEPALPLEWQLRMALLDRPGLIALREALADDAPTRLERAAADSINAATAAGLPCPGPVAQAYALRALRALGRVLAALPARPPRNQLRIAEQLVVAGLWRLHELGLAGRLAMVPLQHLRLHLCQAQSATVLTESVGNALAWGEAAQHAWRDWHEQRFGPVRCIDWSDDKRYCRSLGYRFEQRDYPLRHLVERKLHQDREWERLRTGLLEPLCTALEIWRQLRQPPG